MNNKTYLQVYQMDVYKDEEGFWQENMRYAIATLGIYGVVNKRKILKRLRFGKFPIISDTIHSNLLYIEDYYGNGTWYEVGWRKEHKPILGIAIKNFLEN